MGGWGGEGGGGGSEIRSNSHQGPSSSLSHESRLTQPPMYVQHAMNTTRTPDLASLQTTFIFRTQNLPGE